MPLRPTAIQCDATEGLSISSTKVTAGIAKAFMLARIPPECSWRRIGVKSGSKRRVRPDLRKSRRARVMRGEAAGIWPEKAESIRLRRGETGFKLDPPDFQKFPRKLSTSARPVKPQLRRRWNFSAFETNTLPVDVPASDCAIFRAGMGQRPVCKSSDHLFVPIIEVSVPLLRCVHCDVFAYHETVKQLAKNRSYRGGDDEPIVRAPTEPYWRKIWLGLRRSFGFGSLS